MKRLALLMLVLGVLAAACGDDDGAFTTTTAGPTTTAGSTTTGAEPTTTGAEPTTTGAETTTSEATTTSSTTTSTSTTTTTTAPAIVFEVDTTEFFPPVFPGSNGGHGSGCVTPGFDALPDGVWFGSAEALGGGEITFDLACFWTGTPACDAQIADGFASAPDECLDYYIQNNVATTFAVPVSPDTRVWFVHMLSGDVSSPTEIPLLGWPHPDSFQECPSSHCWVWLYVNGGETTAIVEQYVP